MNSTRIGQNQIIIFTSAPKLEDLCCVLTYISDEEKRDISVKSSYHWQILKCRQLIFTSYEIIASPVLQNLNCICVITNWNFYSSGKLKEHLAKLKLKGQNLIPLSNSIYETCLRYTFIAHLAPLWNQVGNILVQGRNFLESSTDTNAVKMDIGFKDNQMFLILWPYRIKLPKVDLADMNIPSIIIQKFLSEEKDHPLNLSVNPQWLHVLPSLKKGKVVTVSQRLPESCPFKSYKELRRHWKNVYGYRLPEKDENMLYYSLYFPPFPANIYTYPHLCVRPFRPITLPCIHVKGVIEQFILDLTKKIPQVCGCEFKVDMEIKYTTPEILSLSMDTDRPNISNTPFGKPDIAVYDEDLPSNSLNVRPSNTPYSCHAQLPNGSQNLSLMTPTFKEKNNNMTDYNLKNKGPTIVASYSCSSFPQYSKARATTTSTSYITNTGASTQKQQDTKTFVPIFAKKYNLAPKRNSVDNICPVGPKKNLVDVSPSVLNQKFIDNVRPGSSMGKISLQEHVDSKMKMITKQLSKPVDSQNICNIVKDFQLKTGYSTEMQPEQILCIKKSRSRPKVQEDVDVEAYARSGDMTKVNSTTLVKWLRERNVPCRVKDRKPELVNHVMSYLKLPQLS